MGRKMNVNEAHPRTDRKRSGGQRGRTGYGGHRNRY